MLTIIIPSRNERFLRKTIEDVLEKATGEIEVLPVLDGYREEEVKDTRVKYIYLEKREETQKRQAINKAVGIARGKYVMSLDAHCMMAKGFDEVLARDHKEDWVQVPRRHRLDVENWQMQKQSDNRPPIDYEYVMYKYLKMKVIYGFKWDRKTIERTNVPIDETMTIQGSCWFMTKDWFHRLGLMQVEGYSGWGQEGEEISLKTWRAGGKVMVNKNTWYAHLHKGNKYGRGYFMSKQSRKDCDAYSYNYWVNENREFFIKYIEKFNPPGWPKNWKDYL